MTTQRWRRRRRHSLMAAAAAARLVVVVALAGVDADANAPSLPSLPSLLRPLGGAEEGLLTDSMALGLARLHQRMEQQQQERRGENQGDGASDWTELAAAPCLTGRLGAAELWVAYEHVESREVTFRNRARHGITQEDPPCAALLLHVDRARRRRTTSEATSTEQFDNAERAYIVIAQSTQRYVAIDKGRTVALPFTFDPNDDLPHGCIAAAREQPLQKILVKNATHVTPSERGVLAIAQRGHFFAHDAFFEFASLLDSGSANEGDTNAEPDSGSGTRRRALGQISDEMARTVATANSHALVPELLQLLQDEQALLAATAPPLVALDATWSKALALKDWTALRQRTPAQARRALAAGWTVLARGELAATANATTGVDCLRRALAWHPAHVPAYLLVAEVLAHVGQPRGSCESMERMLEHVDAAEFRSGEMRAILTTHFPHCSVIIRMANLWETHAAVRYVVVASVVISFLHGVFVALYFCQDKVRDCFAPRTSTTSTTSDPSSGTGSVPAGQPQQLSAPGAAASTIATGTTVAVAATARRASTHVKFERTHRQ